MWSCSRCTFENHQDLLECELCETVRVDRSCDRANESSSSFSASSASSKSSSAPSNSTSAKTTTMVSKGKKRKKRTKEVFRKGTMVAFKGGNLQGNDDDSEIWMGKIEIYDKKSITATGNMCFVQIFDQISPTVFARSVTRKDLVLIDLEKCNDQGERMCLPLPDTFIRYDSASKCYNTINSISTLFDGTSTSKSSVKVRKGLAKVSEDTSNFKKGAFKHVLLGGDPLELGLQSKSLSEENERQNKDDVGVYDKKLKRIRFNTPRNVALDDEVSKFVSHKNYIGVFSIHTGEQRERAYKAVYRENSKQYIIPGIFQTSVEAARAYDEFVICRLNSNSKHPWSEGAHVNSPPLNFLHDKYVELPLLYTNIYNNKKKSRGLKYGQEMKSHGECIVEEKTMLKSTNFDASLVFNGAKDYSQRSRATGGTTFLDARKSVDSGGCIDSTSNRNRDCSHGDDAKRMDVDDNFSMKSSPCSGSDSLVITNSTRDSLIENKRLNVRGLSLRAHKAISLFMNS